MRKILKSPGKYVQGAGILGEIDEYLQGMGRRLLILISQSGTKRICPTLDACFQGKDYELHYEIFQGECSQTQIDRLTAVAREQKSTVVVGMGTVATHLRDLAKSYKEAQIAIEVGKVFDTEKYIINYENLGIGHLIYQLPTTRCEMFLQEGFKKNHIDALDKETLFTIHKFFENNLNVSETARKLFVHRNTLVYRLEKIKKLTGLDLREFDDAITFKVALMVKKYLISRGIES